MKILLVASDPLEFSGLPRGGRLGDSEIRCVENGVGAERAADAANRALGTFAPDAIVSVGFCGALDAKLAIADIVAGTAVLTGERSLPALIPKTGLRHRAGTVYCSDRIARTIEEKRRLADTGAIAVEMEAGGVGGVAHALGIPFYCIKSVTDLAGESLTNDFNKALRSDGRFDTMKILASSLRHPRSRLPELFRLRKRTLLAARTLGAFIADCRF